MISDFAKALREEIARAEEDLAGCRGSEPAELLVKQEARLEELRRQVAWLERLSQA